MNVNPGANEVVFLHRSLRLSPLPSDSQKVEAFPAVEMLMAIQASEAWVQIG